MVRLFVIYIVNFNLECFIVLPLQPNEINNYYSHFTGTTAERARLLLMHVKTFHKQGH